MYKVRNSDILQLGTKVMALEKEGLIPEPLAYQNRVQFPALITYCLYHDIDRPMV